MRTRGPSCSIFFHAVEFQNRERDSTHSSSKCVSQRCCTPYFESNSRRLHFLPHDRIQESRKETALHPSSKCVSQRCCTPYFEFPNFMLSLSGEWRSLLEILETFCVFLRSKRWTVVCEIGLWNHALIWAHCFEGIFWLGCLMSIQLWLWMRLVAWSTKIHPPEYMYLSFRSKESALRRADEMISRDPLTSQQIFLSQCSLSIADGLHQHCSGRALRLLPEQTRGAFGWRFGTIDTLWCRIVKASHGIIRGSKCSRAQEKSNRFEVELSPSMVPSQKLLLRLWKVRFKCGSHSGASYVR